MFGSLVVVRGWVVGPVFGSWVTAWVSSGCDFWRGCGLWVVGCGWVRYLGCGWVMVVDQRVRMKWVVGCGSAVEVVGWLLVVVRSWSWLGCG